MDRSKIEEALMDLSVLHNKGLSGLAHYAMEYAIGLGATPAEIDRALGVVETDIKGIRVKMHRNDTGALQVVKEVFNL